MKRFLSIMLTAMMLVSLFAVNASAIVLDETYTVITGAHDEATYVDQNYDDIEANADLTTNVTYGRVSVSEGALRFQGEELTAEQLEAGKTPNKVAGGVSVDTAVTYDNAVVTFDLRRNHTMTDEMALYVAFQREANASSEYASLKKYGAVIPINVLEEDVWYEYEVTFDEQNWLTEYAKGGEKAESNANGKIATAKMRKKGDSTWTTLSSTGSNIITDVKKFRSNGSGISVVNTEEINLNVRSYNGVKTEGYSNTDIDVSLDNLKIYTTASEGVKNVYDYAVNTDNICYTAKDGVTVASYAGGNATTNYAYTTNPTAPAEGETKTMVVSFDAKNTGLGMPLLTHISGGAKTYGFDILSRDEILNKWYSYKVVCEETTTAKSLSIKKIFRREEGSSVWEEYNCEFITNVPADERSTQLVAGWWNEEDCTSAKFLVAGCLSSSTGNIRFGYGGTRDNNNSDAFNDTVSYPNMTTEQLKASTAWEVRNVQVVADGAAITGDIEYTEASVTVDASFVAGGTAVPVLAVYNGTTLVDVAYPETEAGEGEVNLTADYAAGNTVKLLIWDSLATGKPYLSDVLDLTPVGE